MDLAYREETLQDLGLTKNESRVLLSLLQKKSASATEIAHDSKVHRVNVYDAIEKLKRIGLVSELSIDGKKVFSAAHPENLLNILHEKELKLKTILPQLLIDYTMTQKSCSVNLYEGANSIRKTLLRFMETKKPIYAWGIPCKITDIIGKTFLEEVHKKRATQKQWMYHIYNRDAIERGKHLNTLAFTKSRHLPEDYDCPVATNLCDDELIMFFLDDPVLTISIKSKQLAAAYEKYFWVLWEKAKEL